MRTRAVRIFRHQQAALLLACFLSPLAFGIDPTCLQRQLYDAITQHTPSTPSLSSIESWSSTEIRFRDGRVLRSSEHPQPTERQYISFELRRLDGIIERRPAQILRIFTENNRPHVEVDIPSHGRASRHILMEAELISARPSQTSRDTFALRTNTPALPQHPGLPALRPAGNLNLEAIRRVGERGSRGEFPKITNLNARLRDQLRVFTAAGGRFTPATDHLGRTIRTAALESHNKRPILAPLVPEIVLQALTEIQVMQVERLPTPGPEFPEQLALLHPRMSERLRLLTRLGVRLDIDPALRLVGAEAEHSPSQRIVRIGPETNWHSFQHEVQHVIFREERFSNLYERMRLGFSEGRLIGEILTSADLESIERLRSVGLQWETHVQSARNGLPIEAANETAAVQVQLDEIRAHASPLQGSSNIRELEHLRSEWIRARHYALRWQIHELSQLTTRTSAQEHTLEQAQAEQATPRCPF